MAVAWYASYYLTENNVTAQQVETLEPVIVGTQELVGQLRTAETLMDMLAAVDRNGLDCDVALSAVRTTRLVTNLAGVFDPDGTPICADADFAPDVSRSLASIPSEDPEIMGGLVMVRESGDRLLALSLSLPGLDLPEYTTEISLIGRDDAIVTLLGEPQTLTDPALARGDPEQPATIRRFNAASIASMPVGIDDINLFAVLDDDYVGPTKLGLIAQSAIMPLGFFIACLGLASILLKSFALRDINSLRQEMAEFAADRRVASEGGIAPSLTSDTSMMRSDFRILAQQLLEEEQIGLARLAHSETLQREVFHRVSNNFQIILSTIRLIAREGSVIEKTDEISQRVQMLSLVHHALHDIDGTSLHSFHEAVPKLLDGVRSAGMLIGAPIETDLAPVHHSVARVYALLHLTIEALYRLDRMGATEVQMVATEDALTITADCGDVPPNRLSDALVKTFARDLKGAAGWQGNVFVASFPEPSEDD
ncbi:sensor histidine kinase [Aliishimia ponticola]|uniref:sensor histidine kinase n=1 Tax=Aliishimia ponticola TaxID=2499833 RepID=UPI00145609B4|nr:sensor histidine kinase [Aliishimia ponticola]